MKIASFKKNSFCTVSSAKRKQFSFSVESAHCWLKIAILRWVVFFCTILAKKVTTCHHQLRKNKTKEFKGPKNRNVSYAIFSILLLNEKNSSVIGKGDCFSSYFIADKINLRMRQGDIIHQTIRKRYKKKFSFKWWWTLFSSANFNIRVRKKCREILINI